jgi:hypothetical protein
MERMHDDRPKKEYMKLCCIFVFGLAFSARKLLRDFSKSKLFQFSSKILRKCNFVTQNFSRL